MIRAEQIPDEVAWKLHDKLWKVGGPSVDEVRAALAVALNAWPEMSARPTFGPSRIILPLTQESKDE
jgi:hypothetical protein